jgi:hypothetical protein
MSIYSVDTVADGRGWIVRISDDKGSHEVRFLQQENAQHYASSQRVRLGLPPSSDIIREHEVFELRIRADGEIHHVPYFVESGIVHARIGDKLQMLPATNGDVVGTVERLFRGYLLHRATRLRNSKMWDKDAQPLERRTT